MLGLYVGSITDIASYLDILGNYTAVGLSQAGNYTAGACFLRCLSWYLFSLPYNTGRRSSKFRESRTTEGPGFINYWVPSRSQHPPDDVQ